MSTVARFFPWMDLKTWTIRQAAPDLMAALAVTFMAIPQGVAYAVIADLPPAMGLYAAALPTMVGALMRSSRHVVTGPTNALSLLVAGAVVLASGVEPVTVGVTLALMVGAFQVMAGLLRLGAMVDYISNPVVLGYISGAGLLIGIGQLPNVTSTAGGRGDVLSKVAGWVAGLGEVSGLALAMALGTAASILVLRAIDKRIPDAIVALAGATALSYFLGLQGQGLKVVSDLTPVPSGLPSLTWPDLSLVMALVPVAVACTVLSLVESSAVGRSIAARTGQRLDLSAEFVGQGLANVVAAFVGGYPTSGSLSRSALNEQAGARSRLAGVFAGGMMLLVLLVLGPVVNHTPIAALAGLLLVVAVRLVDFGQIRQTLRSSWTDRLAFLTTFLGTWFLTLDMAIYLGVGIAIVLFLRKARLLVIQELVVGSDLRLKEVAPGVEGLDRRCGAIRIVHLEGRLFFGVVTELLDALEPLVHDPEIRVIVLRLKRTQDMDITVASALASVATRLGAEGRHLLLAGVRPSVIERLERVGALEVLGRDNVFGLHPRWFVSINRALERASELVADDPHHTHVGGDCPIARYHAAWRATVQTSETDVSTLVATSDVAGDADTGGVDRAAPDEAP